MSSLFAGTVLLIVSCQTKTSEPEIKQVKDTTVLKDQEPLRPFGNPALMYGTSLGLYIQALWRTNRFKELASFTDCRGCNKEQIEHFYRSGKFRLDYSLGRLSNMYKERDTIYLTYSNAQIYGTRRKVVLKCCVINDTAKLILPSINKIYTGQ